MSGRMRTNIVSMVLVDQQNHGDEHYIKNTYQMKQNDA